MSLLKSLLQSAKKKNKMLVFPEISYSDRIRKTVLYLNRHKICKCILIGDESALVMQNKKLKNFTIINPKTSELKDDLAKRMYEIRKDKGWSMQDCLDKLLNPIYFAVMLVELKYADGMVAGADTPSKEIFTASLQMLKNEKDSYVSTAMLMSGKNKYLSNVFVLGDCALNINPNKEELCNIASHLTDFHSLIKKEEAKVAFLSYSTYSSSKGEQVDKVREAYKDFKLKFPEIKTIGEVQFDSAVSERIAHIKMKENEDFYGGANIMVFPELDSANICYKAINLLGRFQAIGPISLGLKYPINDLSRGATFKDILCVCAITILQCKEEKK